MPSNNGLLVNKKALAVAFAAKPVDAQKKVLSSIKAKALILRHQSGLPSPETIETYDSMALFCREFDLLEAAVKASEDFQKTSDSSYSVTNSTLKTLEMVEGLIAGDAAVYSPDAVVAVFASHTATGGAAGMSAGAGHAAGS